MRANIQPASLQVGGGGRLFRLPGWTLYVAFGLLLAWGFGYVSGLFPYLGYAAAARDKVSHIGSGPTGEVTPYGVPTMLLLKGQKAIFDYDVEVEGKGGIVLYVTQVPKLVNIDSGTWIRVGATGEGRVEIPIEKTGFYVFDAHFDHLPGGLGRTRYSVKWGAVW
jgi:hypothetical protein